MKMILLFLSLTLQDPPRTAPERVVLRTTVGDLVLAFYPDVAPQHVQQVISLARLGAYDTSEFNFVQPGVLVQLAGHAMRRTPLPPDATGAIQKVPAEFSPRPHRRGVLSMARDQADPNSAESSFCILTGDAPHLNGEYTIFGVLEAGEEVVDLIARLKVEQPDLRIEVEQTELFASPEKLQAAIIRGPIPPIESKPPRPPVTKVMIGWILFLVTGMAVSFVPARHLATRLRTAALTVVLATAFPFFVYTASQTVSSGSAPLAVAVFVGLLIFFRLMSTFERPVTSSKATGSSAAGS
jgi:cyclophilin family peptidyl-prolyl cis-trans isomerase